MIMATRMTVLHVPVEFLLGYLRINLGCFYALVP